MRKRSLFAAVVAGAIARAEIVEFRGRAMSSLRAANVESYAVMSCAQMEGACSGQCAEVWCDGCNMETRHVVRVAARCTNCQHGDLVLLGDVYQRALGSNAEWVSVRWRCVECGLSSGGPEDESDNMLDSVEAICPGSGSSGDIASPIEVSGSIISTENTTNTAEDVADSSGDSSFSDIDLSASTDTNGSGSFIAVIEFPSKDSSDDRHSAIESGSDSVDGSGGNFWAASGSTKPVNGQTAFPTPTFPSISSSIPSSSASPVNGASSSPTQVPAMTDSRASLSNGGSGSAFTAPAQPSGGISPLVSSSSSSADGNSSYSVTASDENPQDKVSSSSTSHGLSGSKKTPCKSQSPASTTASPSRSSGSTDKSSSDGNLSATSAVTKSPFFYASLVLGIVGLIGIIAGYRAKRKRNHHDEMRALRMSMRQSTRTPTPGSNSHPALTSLTWARLDSHDIVIL